MNFWSWRGILHLSAVYLLLGNTAMQASGATQILTPGSPDIIFQCLHCATSFVVDAAAAGFTLACQKCGKPIVVPDRALEAAAGDALRISDLQHQLKENESQRTEITSYINQHSIQLHRWQLRLKELNERQKKIKAELGAICQPAPD